MTNKRQPIGRLDQRVTIQSETITDDGQGGRTSSGWANIANTPTVSAHVAQAQGREGDFEEYRQANEYEIDVTIRNRSDLTETMALVWRGRRYNITSVPPYNYRDRYLVIRAANGVPL